MNKTNLFAIGTLVVMLLIVAMQSHLRPVIRPKLDPIQGEDCIGTPIKVDYSYAGVEASPHECKSQCTDGIIRYILYSDGQATQCETLPGCSDWGEDNGVTCHVQ